MLENFLLPTVALAFVYFCLRACLGLIQHWILNRTIREALAKHPEAVGPLIHRLGHGPGAWTPKLIGISIIVGSLAIGLAILLEKVAGLDPDLQLALVVILIGGTLYILGRRTARGVAEGAAASMADQASSSMSQ